MMKCKRLSIDDLSRYVPIYRNGHFRKMRPQFRKLHFRKLKTQQRTFNHAQLRSKLQNWDIFVEIVSNDAGIVTMILLQALTFTKKKKKKKFIEFLSSKRQKRGFSVDVNVQPNSRCKFETKCVFVHRHSAQIVFVV